jgi:hypothetical protein
MQRRKVDLLWSVEFELDVQHHHHIIDPYMMMMMMMMMMIIMHATQHSCWLIDCWRACMHAYFPCIASC